MSIHDVEVGPALRGLGPKSWLPGSVLSSWAGPGQDAGHLWASVSSHREPVGWEEIVAFTSRCEIEVCAINSPRFQWFIL